MQNNTHRALTGVSRLLLVFLFGTMGLGWFGTQVAHASPVTIATGTVYYPDGTTPASGVQVALQNTSGYGLITATDASGDYLFTDDSANYANGTYQLNVTGIAGYLKPSNLPIEFSYTAGQTTTIQDFTLITASKSIDVVVRDTAGEIVTDQDASVNAAILNNDLVQATTIRNSDGTFTLYMTGGTWLLNADVGLSSSGSTSPHWVAIGESQKFSFAEDSTTETAEAEFTVLASESYVEVPFLDVNGNPYTTDGRLDIVYTGISKDFGVLSTKRKIDEEGVGSLYLYPGVWTMAVSRDTMPEEQSLPPEQMTFVVSDTPGTTTLEPIQFVENAGTIQGTMYMVSYDAEGNATEELATNRDATFINLSTGENFVQTSSGTGIFTLPEAGLGDYAVSMSGSGIIPLLSANATVTVDQPFVTGLVIKGTLADTTLSGTVQLDNTDVTNQPAVVVLEGNGQRFTAPLEADGSYTLEAYSEAFGDVIPKIFLATEPGAEIYSPQKLEVSQIGIAPNIELDLTVNDNEATISGQLQNQAGTNLTAEDLGENSQVMAINLKTGSVEQAQIQSDGTYELAVAPGTWTVVPKLEKGIDEVIVSPSSNETVEVAAGEAVEDVTVAALSAKAELSGTVKDPDGNAISEAPVIITNLPALQEQAAALGTTLDPAEIITISTASDSDGHFSQSVPKNTELTVYFGSNPETTEFTEPQAETVEVGTDNASVGTVNYRDAEATLTGSLPEGTREGSVSVYSPTTGGTQTTEVNEDGTFSLSVTPGEWKVAVSGVQEGEVFLDKGTLTIEAGENTLEPELEATGILVPGAVTTTGDATETIVVSNSEGASVALQPYAAAFEGDIDLTLSPDPSILFVNGIAQVGLAYDVTAVDENGFAVSQLNVPATITLPIEESAITNADLELVPSYYQPAVESFLFDVSGEQNESKMVISSSHFSRFSMVTVGNNTVTKPTKPRRTEVNTIRKISAILDWKAPTDSLVQSYTVQVREQGVKNKDRWTTYADITKTQKKVNDLTTGTQYQFRVKAKNTQGQSKYTDWKKFTTK